MCPFWALPHERGYGNQSLGLGGHLENVLENLGTLFARHTGGHNIVYAIK